MRVVLTLACSDHYWDHEQDDFEHQVDIPEPYQAGDCARWVWASRVDDMVGHEPGPCCTARTCGWMGRPMTLGNHAL